MDPASGHDEGASIQLSQLPEAPADHQGCPTPPPEVKPEESHSLEAQASIEHQDDAIQIELPPQGSSNQAVEHPLSQQNLDEILKVANKLVGNSGVQAEVFKCMMEDAEVRELVQKQHKLITDYLRQNQPAVSGTPDGLRHRHGSTSSSWDTSTGAQSEPAPQARQPLIRNVWPGLDAELVDDKDEDNKHRPLHGVLHGLLGWADRAKATIEVLGGHLLHHGGRAAHHLGNLIEKHTRQGGDHAGDGSGEQHEGGQRREVMMDAVMVVSVAMVCLSLMGRPLLLATAAAATYLWQKQVDRHQA